jgi:ribosomal protein L24
VVIEKGTRVQVLTGPFRGKLGVVQEIEPGGVARVMLGLLATHVDTKDLIAAAEGKDRPALASSHRKPIGAR